MQLYVFGYGSLTNPKSVAKTLPGKREVRTAVLNGYQRKINAPVNGYLYLNIVPKNDMRVPGVLIAITSEELETLKHREPGYACLDITDRIDRMVDGKALTFIAPNVAYPNMKIPRSYLRTCLLGASKEEAEQWLQETTIENEIEEDLANPVYMNSAFD